MAKISEELFSALPALTKAVFSQPVDKADSQKHSLRPVTLKGQRLYQLESFRDNKAFHQISRKRRWRPACARIWRENTARC